jgi:hypothetical protein
LVTRKPAILIYTNDPDPDFMREICAGIEEEGVLFEIVPSSLFSAQALAESAAEDSMLGSGIGIFRQDAAMQIRGARKDRSVFSYHMPTYAQARELGENSARAIKKIPFRGR